MFVPNHRNHREIGYKAGVVDRVILPISRIIDGNEHINYHVRHLDIDIGFELVGFVGGCVVHVLGGVIGGALGEDVAHRVKRF